MRLSIYREAAASLDFYATADVLRVPVWDAMEIAAAAKAHGAQFVGPNTLGVISPGRGVVGMIVSYVAFNGVRASTIVLL